MQYFKRYYIVYILSCAFVCGAAVLAAREAPRLLAAAAVDRPEAVVVIDPGHGGDDGGAVSPNGTRESNLNLEISRRLNDLCLLMGFRTRMLRCEDVDLSDPGAKTVAEKKGSDLRKRVELIAQTPGALLISIHQNSFPEGKYHGAQVFYADTGGSRELAELLQARCRVLDPENHRVCKPSEAVYLMEHISCTGILLECGFLTNAEEERRLKTDDYQKQLCCAVCSALSAYHSGAEQEET